MWRRLPVAGFYGSKAVTMVLGLARTICPMRLSCTAEIPSLCDHNPLNPNCDQCPQTSGPHPPILRSVSHRWPPFSLHPWAMTISAAMRHRRWISFIQPAGKMDGRLASELWRWRWERCGRNRPRPAARPRRGPQTSRRNRPPDFFFAESPSSQPLERRA